MTLKNHLSECIASMSSENDSVITGSTSIDYSLFITSYLKETAGSMISVRHWKRREWFVRLLLFHSSIFANQSYKMALYLAGLFGCSDDMRRDEGSTLNDTLYNPAKANREHWNKSK